MGWGQRTRVEREKKKRDNKKRDKKEIKKLRKYLREGVLFELF